jgi:hypothetical protein
LLVGLDVAGAPATPSLPRFARGGLWLLTSSLLLLGGFALVAYGLYGLAIVLEAVPADKLRSFQVGMAIYFRVVFFQGLLPGLVLALLLWPAAARVIPRLGSSRARLLGGLTVCASLAYAAVGPLLLTTRIEGEPAMKMQGAFDQIASAALMIGAVALAAWLPRAFLPALRTTPTRVARSPAAREA